jgi:hypothetical protein
LQRREYPTFGNPSKLAIGDQGAPPKRDLLAKEKCDRINLTE